MSALSFRFVFSCLFFFYFFFLYVKLMVFGFFFVEYTLRSPFQTRTRKPRKPKEVKTAITKEIIEENESSGEESKKLKTKVDKVS